MNANGHRPHRWSVLALIPISDATASRLGDAMVDGSRSVSPPPPDLQRVETILGLDSFEAVCADCRMHFLDGRGTPCTR